jgi:hypothetical protein
VIRRNKCFCTEVVTSRSQFQRRRLQNSLHRCSDAEGRAANLGNATGNSALGVLLDLRVFAAHSRLVDRVNINCVIAGGFFLWSAAAAATGLVRTFSMLFALRLLLGIGESVPVEKPRGRNIFATLAVSVPQNGFFAGLATYGHPRSTALIIFPLPHGSLPPSNFQLFRHGLLTA